MKFLLDQGLPLTAAAALRQVGIAVVHVEEVGMHAAKDSQIVARAVQAGEVIVTLDADFHALLARAGARGPSVIRFKIEGLKGPQFAVMAHTVIVTSGADLAAGAAVTVDIGPSGGVRVRTRMLPLTR